MSADREIFNLIDRAAWETLCKLAVANNFHVQQNYNPSFNFEPKHEVLIFDIGRRGAPLYSGSGKSLAEAVHEARVKYQAAIK